MIHSDVPGWVQRVFGDKFNARLYFKKKSTLRWSVHLVEHSHLGQDVHGVTAVGIREACHQLEYWMCLQHGRRWQFELLTPADFEEVDRERALAALAQP